MNWKAIQTIAPGRVYEFALKPEILVDKTGKTSCRNFGEEGHLKHFREYSFFGCMEECISQAEIDACGCASYISILYETAPRECFTIDLQNCAYARDTAPGKVKNQVSTRERSDNIQIFSAQCKDACPKQCSEYNYNVLSNWAAAPQKSFLDNLWVYNASRDHISVEYLQKNIFEVNIRMFSMVESRIEKTRKYSFIQTIGTFGALCGFFMGASFMTLVEIFFFLKEFLCVFIGSKCNDC